MDGVADGDTLTVLDAEKRQHKVRLHGIDAPEKGQPFGAKAKEALAGIVFKKDVTVEVKDTDRYGRVVGKVKQGGVDVNLKMVKDGFAWQYRRYDKSRALLDAEEEARNAKRGLWAGADLVPPWEFRRTR